jgi:hypothetical protein
MPRLDATRQIGVNEQTYNRRKKTFGGEGTDQLKELKRLQKENAQLRRAVADLTLDKLILAEPLSPVRSRACIDRVRAQLGVSERSACSVLIP